MFFLLCFVAIGLATALPTQENINYDFSRNTQGTEPRLLENIVQKLIHNAIEDLRKTLQENSDPLVFDHIFLDGADIGLVNSYIWLKDTTIRNLSTFLVNRLKAKQTSLWGLKYIISFDISIPTVDAIIDAYKLNATIEDICINGEGQAKFVAVVPKLVGALEMRIKRNGFQFSIEVLNADVKFLLKGFKSSISGIFNDALISEMIDDFLEEIMPKLVIKYENDISRILNAVLPKIINDNLKLYMDIK